MKKNPNDGYEFTVKEFDIISSKGNKIHIITRSPILPDEERRKREQNFFDAYEDAFTKKCLKLIVAGKKEEADAVWNRVWRTDAGFPTTT